VYRHRFDADPEPTSHFEADPDDKIKKNTVCTGTPYAGSVQ
jgi:hypothetical protein